MKLKEIYDRAVPINKRKEEHYNFWVSIALRPASILATAPFIKPRINPTTITKISVICLLIGFGFVSFGQTVSYKVIGWLFFFLWGVFDCVDGNLARINDMKSMLGDLWDTMGGYIAMVLIYFSAGIAAYYDSNMLYIIEPHWYIILGGFCAIMSIFPRLMMQKKKASYGESESVQALANKDAFSLSKIIALNFISPVGFMQVILLLAIVFHFLNIYVCIYSVILFGVMVLSLRQLLKE